MRTEEELNRLHALLGAICAGNFDNLRIGNGTMTSFAALGDFICWLRECGHPTAFDSILNRLSFKFADAGYEFDLFDELAKYEDRAARCLPEWTLPLLNKGQITLAEAISASRVEALEAISECAPVRPGLCTVCEGYHRPHFPHDPWADRFRLAIRAETGLNPTWIDAIADCPEWSQAAVLSFLDGRIFVDRKKDKAMIEAIRAIIKAVPNARRGCRKK